MTHNDTSVAIDSSTISTVLAEQHEHAKTAMSKVVSASGPDRVTAFAQLRCLLAAHEAAEEETLHAIAKLELGSDAAVTDRLNEETEAGTAIAALEALDVDSDQFATDLTAFQSAVISHAEAEEHVELPATTGHLTDEQQAIVLAALAGVADLAQNADGQLTANGDTFAAMLGTARDLFRAHAST